MVARLGGQDRSFQWRTEGGSQGVRAEGSQKKWNSDRDINNPPPPAPLVPTLHDDIAPKSFRSRLKRWRERGPGALSSSPSPLFLAQLNSFSASFQGPKNGRNGGKAIGRGKVVITRPLFNIGKKEMLL